MIWGMKKVLQNWNTWLWIGKMSSVWTLFPLTPLCWSLFFLPSVPCAGQAVLQLHGAKQTLGWKAGEGNCSLPQTECLRSRQGCGVSEFGAGEGKCPAEAERHERRVPRRSKEGRLKLRCYQERGRDWGMGLLGRSEPCRNGVWWKSCCTPPSAFLEVALVLRVPRLLGEDNPCHGPFWHCQSEEYNSLPEGLKWGTVHKPCQLLDMLCLC